MIKLMMGNNFDLELIDFIIEENKNYSNIKINEVFGSIRDLNTIQTARPDFRVPEVDLDLFSEICHKLNDNGVIVNYTINTPLVDHKDIDEKEYEKFLNELYDFGVRRITVAHPLIIKIIGKIFPKMKVELSTIYRIQHPRQLYDIKGFNPSFNKICVDVIRNRDYYHLEDMKKYCDELDIEIELLVNEFCIYNCVVRDQCYHAHVMNKIVEDTKHFNHWPMGYCISKRSKEPIEWLYATFILPQHMKLYYDEFGIENFKVTGRTAPTPYAKWVAKTYLDQDYKDNLLKLWQDVKNIPRVASGKDDFIGLHYSIDSDKIDDNFIKWYFNRRPSWSEEKEHIEKYFEKSFREF